MRMSRRLNVSEEDRNELERLVRARTTEQRVVLRARIVLLSPRPYVWTASVARILEKVGSACTALERVTKSDANSDALH